MIARLHRLSPAQRLLLGVACLLGAIWLAPPLARWAWSLISPRADLPMLPYGELRVGIDASYPPFGLDVGGELTGLDVDLARAVARELGVPLHFINMGYDGLYDSLRADQADALFSALRVDPLRFGDARYTPAYFDAGQVLVRPADSELNGMADLEGRNLAVEFGTEGELEARRWQRRLAALAVASYDTASVALDAVLAGEADAALVDAISARLWLREHNGLAIAPEYVTHDLYAVAVRVENVRLWEAISAALAKLLEDGTVDRIVAGWL